MAKQWTPNSLVSAAGPMIPGDTLAQEESGNIAGWHVGTAGADFQICYQPTGGSGTILNYRLGQFITADPALYTALGGATPNFPVTWNT